VLQVPTGISGLNLMLNHKLTSKISLIGQSCTTTSLHWTWILLWLICSLNSGCTGTLTYALELATNATMSNSLLKWLRSSTIAIRQSSLLSVTSPTGLAILLYGLMTVS
jgi:hypothetical protein